VAMKKLTHYRQYGHFDCLGSLRFLGLALPDWMGRTVGKRERERERVLIRRD